MHNEQRAIKLAANLAKSFSQRQAPRTEEETLADLANRLERIGRLTGLEPLTVAELGWHVGWALRECGLDFEHLDFQRLEKELTSVEKNAAQRRKVNR